jgi:hypothetical protein
MKNESTLDRLARVLIATSLWLVAYFWVGGVFSIVLYVFGAIMIFTATTGFCLLYKPFGFSTLEWDRKSKKWPKAVMAVLIVILLAGGTYGSLFFTRKFFLEDYNRMNNFYKQTLFLTGQNKRDEAVSNYDKWISELIVFQDKYVQYKPYAIKSDKGFNNDLAQVSLIAFGLGNEVKTGDLATAHKQLEKVRPIFQTILKRNGFSMLAVALVDFHDAMEEVLTPANEKDAAKVIAAFANADTKLKDVEAAANDAEIQAIRKNLDEIKTLAEQGKLDELPAKGAALKGSFVKVYLKRG